VFDYNKARQDIERRTADVKRVLQRQTAQAREMLRRLLDGKITVEPVTMDGRPGFRLTGRLYRGRLLRADVLRVVEAAISDEEANSATVVAPTGFEPVFQP
jgi:hypothetical protein